MRPERIGTVRVFLAVLTGLVLSISDFVRPAQATVCEILQFRFMLGSDSSAYMNVRSGKDCAVKLTPGKYLKEFEVEKIEIVEPPSYGGAKANGTLGTMYRSNPNYKGRDAYAFTVCGSDEIIASCTLVRIKVHVR